MILRNATDKEIYVFDNLFMPAIDATYLAIVSIGQADVGEVTHDYGEGWCQMIWLDGLTVFSDPFRIATKLADFIVSIQNGTVFLRLATVADKAIDLINGGADLLESMRDITPPTYIAY